jgi:hypothetical protein
MMPEIKDTTVPAPPRGLRKAIKAEWMRMAQLMINQGLNPADRTDLLEDFIAIVAEDADLNLEWEGANLREKIGLSRRFEALLGQKLRLRKMLLAR